MDPTSKTEDKIQEIGTLKVYFFMFAVTSRPFSFVLEI